MNLLYRHTLEKQNRELATRAIDAEVRLASLEQRMKEYVAAPPQTLASAPEGAALAAPVCAAPSIAISGGNAGQAQAVGVGNIININVFGREDAAHLGRPAIKELLDHSLSATASPAQAAVEALLRAAMMIYSDPQHPENLTCYLPNKKHSEVMVHGENGWEVQSIQLVVPPMVAKTATVLFDNQPFEEASRYTELMRALRENERAYFSGREMKTVLVRNKALVERALGSLPGASGL